MYMLSYYHAITKMFVHILGRQNCSITYKLVFIAYKVRSPSWYDVHIVPGRIKKAVVWRLS
jgi:hypothetical protein